MSITLNRVEDHEVKDLFRKLAGRVDDLGPAMNEIGAIVHASVVKNFEVGGRYGQVGDWRGGTRRWEPLQRQTLRARNSYFRKFKETTGGEFDLKSEKRRKEGILQVSARLRNSIDWDIDRQGVVIGTNLAYAGIQHRGGKTRPHVIRPRRKQALAWPGGFGPVAKVNHPGSEIPARPFLVVQDEDLVEIKKMLFVHLTQL